VAFSPNLIPMTCGNCGRILDCHHSLFRSGATPSDGDAMLCAKCGALGVCEAGVLRPPTPAEAKRLRGDPRIAMALFSAASISSVDEAIKRWGKWT